MHIFRPYISLIISIVVKVMDMQFSTLDSARNPLSNGCITLCTFFDYFMSNFLCKFCPFYPKNVNFDHFWPYFDPSHIPKWLQILYEVVTKWGSTAQTVWRRITICKKGILTKKCQKSLKIVIFGTSIHTFDQIHKNWWQIWIFGFQNIISRKIVFLMIYNMFGEI